mgnify:CR=1 FL=1
MRRGRLAGGNQLFAYSRAESDTRVQSHDVVWIKIIKAALMEDRFRLVQQPIASLQGHDAGMADVLVRDQTPRDIWDQHARILEAVAAGQADQAEALARAHISQAADFMVQRLRTASHRSRAMKA